MVKEDTSKVAARDELYNVHLQSWTWRAVASAIVCPVPSSQQVLVVVTTVIVPSI